MKWFLLAVAALVGFSATVSAEDKKPEGPVTLKLVAKKDNYKFDGGGKTADEYKKELEATAKGLEDGTVKRPPAILAPLSPPADRYQSMPDSR